MEQYFDILSNLEVRLVEGFSPKSINHTSTAIFQFVARGTNKFLDQIDVNYHPQFEAFYKHKNQFYPHPYTLRIQMNHSMNNTLTTEHYQQIPYDISLYLELKRLQDFDIDDLKRYYETIDDSIDNDEEHHDFHDIYLILHYNMNGQLVHYPCNNGQPIHLPKFISNPWTHKNTLTRFRYDAENRDGTFPCEMTLHHGNISNLQSYKIVLCLVSNTIPPRMDYHGIRWLCKLKSKATRRNGSSTQQGYKEKSYTLNHPSGIVIAQVFGPNLKFSPQSLQSINNLNYVRSYFEPKGFRTELHKLNNKETSAFAVAVIKGTDYPIYMKSRRKDINILQYLPFNELEDDNKTIETTNEYIIKRLKIHKEQRNKQLILSEQNSNGTYSQTHVRLHVAAYNENDILLTESLYPPLRNSKTFEQLRIIRIVQPRHELHANEPAFIYCDYDYNKSKPEEDLCPYEFQLVFTRSIITPDKIQLLQLFNKPHISVTASFVPNCPCLLQFQVPNNPEYHENRIFIRLRHKQSKDYNPSDIALCDNEYWKYYADQTSVMDIMLDNNFYAFNDPLKIESSSLINNIELQIQPVNQILTLPDLSFDSDDNNYSYIHLNTPDFKSTTTKRFSFSHISTEDDNHE